MKITVKLDTSKCAASEMCIQVAPGKFVLTQDGYSQPTSDSWTAEDLPMLLEAEQNCPTASITVETDGS